MTSSVAHRPPPTAVELPFDRPRPDGPAGPHLLASIPWDPAALSEALDGSGVSGEAAHLSAWAVVLSTYSGHTDVTLGVIRADRRIQLTVTVSPSTPFSKLAEEVAEELDSSRPLTAELPALFASSASTLEATGAEQVALTIAVSENEITARYDSARFEATTAERILRHLHNVLSGVSRGLETPVGDLEVVTADELALIDEWNSTRLDWGAEETLASLFAQAVQRWPDRVALVYEDRSLTYRQLSEATTAVATELRNLGVGPGSMVGVLCERSIELVVALHGVVLAGGAYVPLDPEYPPDRLGYMISETEMEVVLCQDRFRHLLEDASVTALEVAEVTRAGGGEDVAALSEGVRPEDVAYVIYTSGSTGRPKGVANSHRGVANRLLWMQDHFRLGPDNVAVQKTPFSFDVSVWEFFWPLQTGARLVVARPDGHKDPAYLIETINAHGVDTIHFVPSMLRLFLDHPAAGSCTSLRRVICSGEALTRDLQDRFFEVLPEAELHNLYGPTEAAIDVTAWQCRPDDALPVVPIGRPIANTTIDILDDDMRPVPIGVPAELYIGGVQVALGYVNRPDLTSERFLDDPRRPGERLYKTGDLARWLPNGAIDFLGRLDHQVKVRGQRIELGEIEATLGEHPSILEATVTVDRSSGDAALIAHLMWRAEPASDAGLRAFLAKRLPPYMIPNRFVSHHALPLTTSGKVDRNALADATPEQRRPGSADAGSGPLEQMLLAIWRSVLGRPDVGVHDRVFDLGATSLQAAAFVNEVQRELGEFIYVVTVFTSPTVSEYAAFLSEHYPEAIRRRFGGEVAAAAHDEATVDSELVAKMDTLVPRLGPFPRWREGPPNPPAAFILAPPRSGTTLLRVMLAGHSGVFAAPELQLLGFDDLPGRREALSGRFSPWLEGTIRAVMDLEGCDADTAGRFVAGFEEEGLSCKRFFHLLQERAGGRLIVDKSPGYALDLEVLRNAEAGFERPRYLHLVREPGAMSRSFESYHMDQILFLGDHSLPARLLGELVWTVSHRNILDFAQEIDEDRLLRIRFEDLVADPRPVMEQVADFLGIGFEEALLRPYDDLESKMVDGLHAASTPMGDTRLLERDRIDPDVVSKWSGQVTRLGEPTRRLARMLGYGEGRRQVGRRRDYAAAARQRRGGGRER